MCHYNNTGITNWTMTMDLKPTIFMKEVDPRIKLTDFSAREIAQLKKNLRMIISNLYLADGNKMGGSILIHQKDIDKNSLTAQTESINLELPMMILLCTVISKTS